MSSYSLFLIELLYKIPLRISKLMRKFIGSYCSSNGLGLEITKQKWNTFCCCWKSIPLRWNIFFSAVVSEWAFIGSLYILLKWRQEAGRLGFWNYSATHKTVRWVLLRPIPTNSICSLFHQPDSVMQENGIFNKILNTIQWNGFWSDKWRNGGDIDCGQARNQKNLVKEWNEMLIGTST